MSNFARPPRRKSICSNTLRYKDCRNTPAQETNKNNLIFFSHVYYLRKYVRKEPNKEIRRRYNPSQD
jgi:hypothetical protein